MIPPPSASLIYGIIVHVGLAHRVITKVVSVLSLGGGVNSTALLLTLVRKGESPDLVLFANTGGERPSTIAHVAFIGDWCSEQGIEFKEVTNGGRGQGETLEENMLARKELPSLAYGFKGCSVKWKRQPLDRYVRDWKPATEAWERGEKVMRLIGIDAGERHRAVLDEDKRYRYRYPLVEWDMGRDECVKEIEQAGWEVPSKSACFYCPAMRRNEILQLKDEHPDLLERALEIERNAETHSVAGLGRNWKWVDFLRQDSAQGKLWADPPEMACGCLDESDDD